MARSKKVKEEVIVADEAVENETVLTGPEVHESSESSLVGKLIAGKKILSVCDVVVGGKSFVQVTDEDRSTILLTAEEASKVV